MAHLLSLESSTSAAGYPRRRAICVCGWRGAAHIHLYSRVAEEAAIEDGDDHRAAQG